MRPVTAFLATVGVVVVAAAAVGKDSIEIEITLLAFGANHRNTHTKPEGNWRRVFSSNSNSNSNSNPKVIRFELELELEKERERIVLYFEEYKTRTQLCFQHNITRPAREFLVLLKIKQTTSERKSKSKSKK